MDLLKRLRNRRKAEFGRTNDEILRYRKIALTGNFFPLDHTNFIGKLSQFKGEVRPELDTETEVLICGKYPDWSLIAKAKEMGIYTIFLDKVSDLFSATREDNYLSAN